MKKFKRDLGGMVFGDDFIYQGKPYRLDESLGDGKFYALQITCIGGHRIEGSERVLFSRDGQ